VCVCVCAFLNLTPGIMLDILECVQSVPVINDRFDFWS